MVKKLLLALALLVPTLASAQDIPAHSVPISAGPGVAGWRQGGPCGVNQAMSWLSGATGDPTCSPVAQLNVVQTWTAAQTFTTITASSLASGGTSCVQANTSGTLSLLGAPCGTGSGAVTGVTNSDGTLTISPTTGAVVASLALGHANTWSGVQTFNNAMLSMAGATSGNTLLEATAVAGAGTIATFPANTGTVAELNLAQTWTALQQFNNNDLALKGATSGTVTLAAIAVAGANTATFPANTGTVAELNLTQTFSVLQNFNSLFTISSGKWFTNDAPPAIEFRSNDGRAFIGDAAVNYPNNSTCGTGDWFTNFENTTSNGPCAYISSFGLVVESSATNSNSTGGILGAGQTKLNNSNGAFGVMGFALNNNSANTGHAFAAYLECDITLVNTHSGCYGLELDVGNFASNAQSGTPDPFTQSDIVGIQVACGSGVTSPTRFQCGSGIQVVNNDQPFKVGINFLNSGITTQTIFGISLSPAVVMPVNYAVVWYSAAGTTAGGITVDNFGNVLIAGNGSLKYNGTVITVP